MKMTAKNIKKTLNNTIKSIADSREKFCKNPNTDFKRKRKISFEDVLKITLTKSGKSTNCELLEYFNFKSDLPTNSAFVQQKEKINHSAFETLFHQFTVNCYEKVLFKGYRLLAVDGSDLHIPTNKNDKDSLYSFKSNARPFNLLHLNALYDLQRHIYVDAVIQKGKYERNEHKAFNTMVDKDNTNIPTIYIADRGYESYNDMAHIQEKNNKFLIRIKDIDSRGNLIPKNSIPTNDEFDIDVVLNLTRKQTNKSKKDVSLKIIPHSSTFDFLPKTSSKFVEMKPYTLNLRFVRFKISEDSYELIVTNLNKNEFSSQDVKKLYAMRWGIETSFRQLKYTLGLLYFNTKKMEHIFGEIFAKLTMYNFVELIVSHAKVKQKDKKFTYQVNFNTATHICYKFLLKNISPSLAEALILQHLVPIRLNATNPRKKIPRAPISFLYRLA